MTKNPVVMFAAIAMVFAAFAGIGACMASISFPSSPARHCVDWDTKQVHKTVTPKPRVVRGVRKTARPYATTIKTKHCDEWATPTPTNS